MFCTIIIVVLGAQGVECLLQTEHMAKSASLIGSMSISLEVEGWMLSTWRRCVMLGGRT